MKPHWYLPVLVGCLTSAIAVQSPRMQQLRDEARKRGLEGVFGQEEVRAYKAASKFTVYRVDNLGKGQPLKQREDLNVISKSVTPSADWIKRFRSAMASPANHAWGSSYKCGFNPGVVVRATDGKKTVDVLFCFGCTEISFGFAGKRRGAKQSIAPGRPTFLKLFREIFPNDQALKSAKDEFDPRHGGGSP